MPHNTDAVAALAKKAGSIATEDRAGAVRAVLDHPLIEPLELHALLQQRAGVKVEDRTELDEKAEGALEKFIGTVRESAFTADELKFRRQLAAG